MSETDVCLELFIYWLSDASKRPYRVAEAVGTRALVADADSRLAIEVLPLVGPTDNAPWLAARDALEQTLVAVVPVPAAIWIPAGADLPAGEPVTSAFIDHLRNAALKLSPNERSHVPLPISVLLRKSADTGGVVSATGGLNTHWARFTEHVRGTFDLDSTQLHRLPESEGHLDRLIDEIVAASKTLETGKVARIETIDAWTIQRLAEGASMSLIGVPPADVRDIGLAVRKNFRHILAEAGPDLRRQEADKRALVVYAPYARIEDEGATVAMRGYDPSLYGGLDFVCLIADGLVKPLIQGS